MVFVVDQLVILGLLAIVASAIPATRSCRTSQQQANFDELPNNSVLPGPAIPVGYKGLNWQSFIVVNQDIQNTSQPQLVPKSPVNYAATISATQLLAGTPLISTNYASSNVTSFTLQEFYYGCAINLGQGVVGLSAPCLVTVSGYRGDEKDLANAQEVCSQQFFFNSDATKAETVQYSGAIKACSNIQFAIFQYSLTGGAAALDVDVGLGLDNVKFTTCGK